MDSPRVSNIDDPHNVALHHPGGGNDEGAHNEEKQSLFKRVKAKAKRMKDNFKGNGGHDHDDDVDEMDTDSDVHSPPGKEEITSPQGTTIKERAVIGDVSPVNNLADIGSPLRSENQPNELKDTPVIDHSTGSHSTDKGIQLGSEKQPNELKDTPVIDHSTESHSTDKGIQLGSENQSNELKDTPVIDHSTGSHSTDKGIQLGSENQSNELKDTPVIGQPTGNQSTGGLGAVCKPKLGGYLEKEPHEEEHVHPANYQADVNEATLEGGEEIEGTPILHELGQMNIHDESTQKLYPNVKTGQQEHQYISTGNHDQFSPEAVTKPQFDATIPISQRFHNEEEQKPESYNDKISREIPTNELGKMNIHDESTQKLDTHVKTGQQEHQNISTGNYDQLSPEAVAKPQFEATIPLSQGFDDEKEQNPKSYNDKLSRETPTYADSTVSFDQQPDQEPLDKKPVAGGYGETISSISSSITKTAGLAKGAVASKLGYGETKEETGPEYQVGPTGGSPDKGLSLKEDEALSKVINEPLDKKPVSGGYGETISTISSSITNTAALAKDAVASRLGYGETQEESGPEYQIGSTDGSSDKGVSVKEDKALSKVTNEALPLHKAKEENPINEAAKVEKEERGTELGEEKKVVVKGRVTESEEVANRLGKAEDTSFDDAGPGLASPGKTVMDRLRNAAGSWFNKSGGEPHVESQVGLGDHIEEGNDGVTQTSGIKETQLNPKTGETGLH